MAKTALKDKLDALGEEWQAKQDTLSPDERLRLSNEVFLVLYALYSGRQGENGIAEMTPETQALADFYLMDWPNYTAAKGKLSAYAASCLKHRKADQLHEDRGDHRITVRDPKTGKPVYKEGKTTPVREWVSTVSLNQEIDPEDDDSPTLMDTLPDHVQEDTVAERDAAEQRTLQLLNLPLKLQGRANNPKRLNYFRILDHRSQLQRHTKMPVGCM